MIQNGQTALPKGTNLGLIGVVSGVDIVKKIIELLS
jgi:hypothetical protein